MNFMDGAGFARDYDIGNRRKDGKFNVWKREDVRDLGREWVIVHVADSFKDANRWIRQRTSGRRPAGTTAGRSATSVSATTGVRAGRAW